MVKSLWITMKSHSILWTYMKIPCQGLIWVQLILPVGAPFSTPETSPSQLRRSRPARHWSAQRQALVRRKGCRGTHRLFGNLCALVMVKCYLIWIGKRLNIWSAFHSFIISVYGGEMCWHSWPALPCPCHCFFWTSPDWISRSQFWLFCWPNHLGLHVFRSFHVSVWGHPPFFGQPEFGVNSIYFQLPLDQHRYGTTYHL